MKKIIINTIIISLLSISAIFADNNTTNNNVNNVSKNEQLTTNNEKAVVTINDMNDKLVYSETFTIDNQNDSTIKLNPDQKLTKGMYVVTVVVDGQKMTQKLIVE